MSDKRDMLTVRVNGDLKTKFLYVIAAEATTATHVISEYIEQCVRNFETEHGAIESDDIKDWVTSDKVSNKHRVIRSTFKV
jgi:hypothetical protein